MKWNHRISLLSAAVFVIGSCLYWFGHAPDFFQEHYGRASEAGSMFGPLSALFSGLGFVGLIYTIILQSEQLKNAKIESLEARKTGERQRFENTFFQLLDLHSRIVDAARLEMPFNQPRAYVGRAAFAFLEGRLREELNELKWADWQLGTKRISDREGFLEFAYANWYNAYSIYVDHYFRVLYRILRHVDAIEFEDRYIYAKIVRAQLSRQELVLLFYNSFSEGGFLMRREVEKHALLKHIHNEDLAEASDKNLYSPLAYKDRFRGDKMH